MKSHFQFSIWILPKNLSLKPDLLTTLNQCFVKCRRKWTAGLLVTPRLLRCTAPQDPISHWACGSFPFGPNNDTLLLSWLFFFFKERTHYFHTCYYIFYVVRHKVGSIENTWTHWTLKFICNLIFNHMDYCVSKGMPENAIYLNFISGS